MLFVISKILGFFALPSNAIVAAGVAGLLLMRTKRAARAGRRLAGASVALMLALGLLPFGSLMMAPLEERFPPWDAGSGAPDGIVVLGGAVETDMAGRPDSSLNEAAERITAAIELARRFPSAKILLSGGNGSLLPGSEREAQATAAMFAALGIPESRLILEDRSRNTAENAAFSQQAVTRKPGERWLLVTSAWHMPRAVGAFRSAGFPVEAYPVDYRTPRAAGLWLPFSAVTAGLRRTDVAAREWIGLAAYRLMGRTSALFPAP